MKEKESDRNEEDKTSEKEEMASNLLSEVIERVIEVGDYETMLAIENLLIEKDEHAWTRDLTKELNQKIEDSEWLIEI